MSRYISRGLHVEWVANTLHQHTTAYHYRYYVLGTTYTVQYMVYGAVGTVYTTPLGQGRREYPKRQMKGTPTSYTSRWYHHTNS